MARIKGALNARKKHNRVLKLANCIRRQKAEEERDEIPLDRSYQRRR